MSLENVRLSPKTVGVGKCVHTGVHWVWYRQAIKVVGQAITVESTEGICLKSGTVNRSRL